MVFSGIFALVRNLISHKRLLCCIVILIRPIIIIITMHYIKHVK